jgi:hypothetical protein
MSGIIYANGSAEIVVAAASSLAVSTAQDARVYQKNLNPNSPNFPVGAALLGTVIAGQTVFGPYANGATIIVEAGAGLVYWAKGVSPKAKDFLQVKNQPTPQTLNTTGALTSALIGGGLVTSTTAAAVTATLDTGTVSDAAFDLAIGDGFDWSAIATGANAFTVTAAAGHTIVGSGVVATLTSGHFRTVKTAANTFITYRLS